MARDAGRTDADLEFSDSVAVVGSVFSNHNSSLSRASRISQHMRRASALSLSLYFFFADSRSLFVCREKGCSYLAPSNSLAMALYSKFAHYRSHSLSLALSLLIVEIIYSTINSALRLPFSIAVCCSIHGVSAGKRVRGIDSITSTTLCAFALTFACSS